MKQPAAWRLAEVWGDTVDLRQLAWAIAIGVVLSVLCFYAASHWLRSLVATPQLAHAYAMLAGLAGCIISGIVCARLFPPKREVVEESAAEDPAWQAEVLEELAALPGGLGTPSDLPRAAREELSALGLQALFEPAQPRHATPKEATA